jgi:hypothetical protein
MLTVTDTPTIRRAIMKRLDRSLGIDSVDMKFAKFPGSHITVMLALNLGWVGGKVFLVNSSFDLPDPFEHGHLLDEIDQVAEQVKAARKDFFGRGPGVIRTPGTQLAGTGRRGLWARYGLRHA